MKTIEQIRNFRLIAFLFMAIAIVGCNNDDDAPGEENEEEVITSVELIFTNTADANDVVRVTAVDDDGPGIGELEVGNDEIDLTAGATYTLTFEILNAVDPNDVEDIGDEIAEEDDEHQIFFSFTNDAFSNPTGNGNIDTASDPINYNDEDSDAQDGSGNPVGLSTTWTAGDTAVSDGSFTVRLQHQPDIKSATTGANDGDSDFDLTFVLNIQ
ncbi:GTP cyclohydrolase [Spongiivirga sp. MCCC 1A20706]|uniref:GTP cyclohydrolase n=1 Tax=Spongiivirga sp. MCCC 1A20706 TaxID=3160963 RepID=UPI003977D20E